MKMGAKSRFYNIVLEFFSKYHSKSMDKILNGMILFKFYDSIKRLGIL
jgi:hypothetical protein